MADEKTQEEINNYRTGILLLRYRALNELASIAEDLRQVRINRPTDPLDEDELSYLKSASADLVNLALELSYPALWIKAPREKKDLINKTTYDSVLKIILEASKPIDEFIASTILGAIESEGLKVLKA